MVSETTEMIPSSCIPFSRRYRVVWETSMPSASICLAVIGPFFLSISRIRSFDGFLVHSWMSARSSAIWCRETGAGI